MARRVLGEGRSLEGAEPVLAWGKPMLLDTTLTVGPASGAPPRLAEIRATLLKTFPQLGPIFV